jgi:3-isopropylmalate dehydrogenase
MILSGAMMLEWLAQRGGGEALREAAGEIRAAVDAAFAAGLRTPDIGGPAGTAEVTRRVLAALGGAG